MAIPDGFDVNNPQCPKCGGKCWDNREIKRNPKQPDWKCKDKNCNGAVWIQSQKDNANQAQSPVQKPQSAPQPAPQPAYQPKPKLSKDAFWALQRDFFYLGITIVNQAAKDTGLGLSDYEVAGLAQDMQAQALIALDRGCWALEVEPVAEPAPQTAPQSSGLGEAANGYVQTLSVCATDADCDGVRTMFMVDQSVKPEERPALLKAWMDRKHEITVLG